MNFKRELLEKIIKGQKTQTRRPVKKGQYKAPYGEAVPDDYIKTVRAERVLPGGQHQLSRVVFEVGKDVAACPGRGKPAMWWTINVAGDTCIWPYYQKEQPAPGYKQSRILITNIRREDVRTISHADALAEGFEDRLGFWMVWTSFYLPKQHAYIASQKPESFKNPTRQGIEDWCASYLMLCDDSKFDAWALTFKLQ